MPADRKKIIHLWKGREHVQISNSDKWVTIILDKLIYLYFKFLRWEVYISGEKEFLFNEFDIPVYNRRFFLDEKVVLFRVKIMYLNHVHVTH